VTIPVINGTTVMVGGSDPSLAGRPIPAIKPLQLRPQPTLTGTSLGELKEARRYSDNQLAYLSIFQNFTLPITFQPTRPISVTPLVLESILSISCKMTGCELESPTAIDNPTISEPDGKGGAKLKLPKFDAKKTIFWKGGNFNEPRVLGGSTGVPGPISLLPVIATYTAGPGVPAIYNISGYFTERNFFDREWITQFKFLLYKINSNGIYWNNPLLDQFIGSMIGINGAKWFQADATGPDRFYSLTKELAKKTESPIADKYIKGAEKIIQYKPSEIGSLRFYFVFTVTTNFPAQPIEIFEATMSVRYDTQYGTARLKLAQKKQGTGKPEKDPAQTEENIPTDKTAAQEQAQAKTASSPAEQASINAEFEDAMKATPEELSAAFTIY
jgi:hypothetical protein